MFAWEALRPLCYGQTAVVIPDDVVIDTSFNTCGDDDDDEKEEHVLTVKKGVQVFEGSSGSSSSSTEVPMEGITTGQGGNKTFSLEGQ